MLIFQFINIELRKPLYIVRGTTEDHGQFGQLPDFQY